MNSFTGAFRQFLAGRHPSRLDTSRIETDGAIYLEIPCPNARAVAPLWLSSENEEVSVGFDRYHTHFGSWTGQTDEAAFASAIAFAEQILAERQLVVVSMNGDKWAGSTAVAVDALTDATRETVGYVVSWLGTFDRALP